ncbi:MAG: hypothetical protein ACI37J_00855, partial [Candidatus Bruticola sp.]
KYFQKKKTFCRKAGRFFFAFFSQAALQAQICCMKNCVDINEIYSRKNVRYTHRRKLYRVSDLSRRDITN